MQNQNTCCIVPNEAKLDQRFLYYRLKLKDFVWNAANCAGGSANQARIPVKMLGTFQFKIPSLPEQKSIAQILGTLDDKIELNRRMNETLESMARALFKSWFVDFDPVIDNALAAGNSIPEPLQARAETRRVLTNQTQPLPAHIQKLFPNSFVFTDEIGWVAEGWEIKQWGDIATLEYGKSLKGYRGSVGPVRVWGTNRPIGWGETALCDSAGIIIGRKGAYRGVHYSPDPFFVIDTAFYLKPKSPLDLKWAYYELLQVDINRAWIQAQRSHRQVARTFIRFLFANHRTLSSKSLAKCSTHGTASNAAMRLIQIC